MHTVFINDQPLHFINIYDTKEIELSKGHAVHSEKDKSIGELIADMELSNEPGEIYYLSEKADIAWKIFISHCTLIEAAGGLVQNDNGEFLLIFRQQKWDLPKGKMEYDETPEQTAAREIEEECGVNHLSVIRKLPLTFHTYKLKEKRMLKKNHWFHMHTESDAPLVPEREEDIEEVCWMDKNTIRTKVLKNTYSAIAGLLNQFFGWH